MFHRPLLFAAAAVVVALSLADRPAVAQDTFEEFRRRMAEKRAGNVSVTVKDKNAEEATPVELGDAPEPSFAGLVADHAILVSTVNERAKARLNPGIEKLLVEEEYEAAVKAAEQDVLYEWAQNVVLALEAEAAGITVEEREIDERLDEIALASDRPGEAEAVLAEFGIRLDDFRKELGNAVLAEKLVMKNIERLYSDADLRKAYEKNLSSFYRPERVHVRGIVQDLAVAHTAEDFDLLNGKMKAAAKALDRGIAFAHVAEEYSCAPISRARGGDMGWIERSNPLPPPIDSKVFDLVVGRPSKILASEDGRFLYILEVMEKRPEEVLPYESVRREVRMLVYDEAKALVYDQARRRYKCVLNPSGIADKYLEGVDRGTLNVI